MAVEQSGVKLNRKTTDFVATGEVLRPLKDYLVIRPLQWNPSALIEVAGGDRHTLRGVVVSVGPGRYPWIYNTDRSQRRLSRSFVPTQVKAGDVVELGGLEINGYSFPEIMIGGERHFLCQEQDVCGVVV